MQHHPLQDFKALFTRDSWAFILAAFNVVYNTWVTITMNAPTMSQLIEFFTLLGTVLGLVLGVATLVIRRREHRLKMEELNLDIQLKRDKLEESEQMSNAEQPSRRRSDRT